MSWNPFLFVVGGVWLVFGLAEFVLPSAARLLLELLYHRTIVLPLTRIGMGILLIVGVLFGRERSVVLVVLGFLCEIAGFVTIFLSDENRQAYLYWLRSRPFLTFRLMGIANTCIASFILKEALF